MAISRLAERFAKRTIFIVAQSPLAFPISKAGNSMHGVVQAHPMTDGIAEYSAKEAHGAAGGGLPAPHPRQAALLSTFGIAGRLTDGHIVHEIVHVLASDGGNLKLAKQWLDVAFDAPTIDFQRRRFLRHFTPREQSSGLRIGEVEVAQLRHGGGLTFCPLRGRGVFAFFDLSEQALRLCSSRLRGPGRTVSADSLPALSAFQSPID